MKKAMMRTALAVFAFAPAMAWADCDFHNQAAMAQMASAAPAGKATSAQAASTKASAPVVAKASAANAVKRTSDKPASPASKSGTTTVVAKSN